MNTAHTSPTSRTPQGWRLLGFLSLGLLLLAAAVLALDPSVEGVRRLIRVTARTSLLLFLLAFTASAAARHWPGAWTRWQVRNRRYLGLGFAVSHTIHALAIATFAQLDPVAFHQASSVGNFISGGIAYGFIVLLAATSFDATAAWLGRPAWQRLHLAGMYYLWISFMITFGKRIPMSPAYVVPIVVLLLALAFRLWPRRAFTSM